MNEEERISNLAVEDVLALIDSSQEEVVKEVRSLIKDQFSTVNDRWLVSGLLDYFFSTNSKRILDMLIGAPEPHCKYLLEKISNGLKSGERFRYISLFLYCISRKPPPIWIYKMPNYLLKDLFDILTPTRDSDISVLVNGVMVLVILLPLLPLEFTKFKEKLFDCFWRLIFWSPSRQEDLSLKPYLQVAVYSLFHRIYALYPCALISYLRSQTLGNLNKASLVDTLRPMLEQVRLHPLLISETKDSEVSRTRWSGMEPNDLIHECAKLCLDPLHEVYEEVAYSSMIQGNPHSECSEFLTLCSSDNAFWSPGNSNPPSALPSSVPHTPVYAIQKTTNISSSKVAESPPEAAIEATPESTPFTSPLPQVNVRSNSTSSGQNSKPASVLLGTGDSANENKFSFPLKMNQDLLLSQWSKIQQKNKPINEIEFKNLAEGKITNSSYEASCSVVTSNVENDSSALASENSQEIHNGLKIRKRKLAVCISKHFIDNETKNDLFADETISDKSSTEASPDVEKNQPDMKVNGEKTPQNNDDKKEELDVETGQSMTELIKSVKTNRLRFLSQCGPPPNISHLTDNNGGSKKTLSPPNSFPSCISSNPKSRRHSYPDYVGLDSVSLPLLKRENTISPFSLSPVKCPVEMIEIATQTEDSTIHDPYEQMLEILTLPATERKSQSSLKSERSPYEFIDDVMQSVCKENINLPNLDAYWNVLSNQSDCKCGSHLRSLYCLLMMERFKREVHADRNRRLLGKIKKLHLLQEINQGLIKEKFEFQKEVTTLSQSLKFFQDKVQILEDTLKDMVEKRSLFEVQRDFSCASLQRDHLQNECHALKNENATLNKKIQNNVSMIKEYERKLSIYEKHSAQNTVLRSQVEELNKRLLVMGEIQIEMRQQIVKNKETQKKAALEALAYEKALFRQQLQDSENQHRAEKTSLHAALHRINELEKKLSVQSQEKENSEREKFYLVSSLEEKCAALKKRNQQICAINSTLESQMHSLSCSSRKSDNEQTFPSSSKLGSSLPSSKPDLDISLSALSEPSISSFLGQASSTKQFRPIQYPKPQEQVNNSS